MTPFLFYFTFYLNLNQKASKMAKKPKDFKTFTDPCHSYPIQNSTHNPTRFLTLIIFLLPLSPLMFLSLLHFKTKSKFKKKYSLIFFFLSQIDRPIVQINQFYLIQNQISSFIYEFQYYQYNSNQCKQYNSHQYNQYNQNQYNWYNQSTYTQYNFEINLVIFCFCFCFQRMNDTINRMMYYQ